MKLLSPFRSPRSKLPDVQRKVSSLPTSRYSVDVTVSSDDSSSCYDPVHRVRFAQEAVQYESPWVIVKDAFHVEDAEKEVVKKIAAVQPEMWYHKTDIGRFKSDAQVSARMLQLREKTERTSWFCETMWDAFVQFRKVDSCDAMNTLMNTSANLHVDPDHVGLEKWLRDGSAVRSRTRKLLHADMMTAQTSDASPKQLRKLCREHSRGSRLYGHFLGRALASSA